MGWLRKRFGESSTYTGMGLLATVAAYLAGPEAVQSVAPIATILIGVYDAVRPEKS
ncbi:hypothetical protein JYT97_03825 [Haliea sp. AH-315-K21]|nr:hypothetical protein [Haliea sp. AH-315-K21]